MEHNVTMRHSLVAALLLVAVQAPAQAAATADRTASPVAAYLQRQPVDFPVGLAESRGSRNHVLVSSSQLADFTSCGAFVR